ncbi:type VI secretion system baseplate subunit TssF, partial [Bacillus pseudomycoides]|uniref:type VI secretion system baseplate subunit TssF n=1 Tax=Bacillus pseudomycoides TaxID=64104 RepID=UPI000C001AD2
GGMSPNRLGTDLMVSLVDTQLDPLADTRDYSLTAELLCTSRHLAQSLPAGTPLGFERPGPVAWARLRNS